MTLLFEYCQAASVHSGLHRERAASLAKKPVTGLQGIIASLFSSNPIAGTISSKKQHTHCCKTGICQHCLEVTPNCQISLLLEVLLPGADQGSHFGCCTFAVHSSVLLTRLQLLVQIGRSLLELNSCRHRVMSTPLWLVHCCQSDYFWPECRPLPATHPQTLQHAKPPFETYSTKHILVKYLF